MFRSMWCRLGSTLKRAVVIGGGEPPTSSSAPPPAKYFLFTLQNQFVGISKSRVITSTSYCFSTTSGSDGEDVTCSDSGSNSSFVVSYLINSCGLSENQAVTASKLVNFKTPSKPDSVLTLFKSYGFTELHISKLVTKDPYILSLKPDRNLKPKLDFFKSKLGNDEHDLANFISNDPAILRNSFDKVISPSFNFLKTIVHSDQNVIKIIRKSSWILSTSEVKSLIANLELLRNEGVPETNIVKYLIKQPRVFTASRFEEIVEKVKGMGFNHLQTTFLKAIHGLASMTEANWRKKMDVYKRWGWSEDQIQSAFRKSPDYMMVSEKKIMAIMDFLVYEMGYDSSIVAENPIVFTYSLKDRIIPRGSVIRSLVSKGQIQENIPINSLSVMVDEHFVDKFVTMYEQQVPELMKIFQGQLNYQELLQN